MNYLIKFHNYGANCSDKLSHTYQQTLMPQSERHRPQREPINLSNHKEENALGEICFGYFTMPSFDGDAAFNCIVDNIVLYSTVALISDLTLYIALICSAQLDVCMNRK